MKSLRKSFLKRTSVPKRSAIKRKPRKPSETLRIYGPKARRDFVRGLPCAACRVEGYSVQAHVLGNGGTGRKADYTTIAPLCAEHGSVGESYFTIGCHTLFDEFPWVFKPRYPDFNPETAAAETENLWREHNDKA